MDESQIGEEMGRADAQTYQVTALVEQGWKPVMTGRARGKLAGVYGNTVFRQYSERKVHELSFKTSLCVRARDLSFACRVSYYNRHAKGQCVYKVATQDRGKAREWEAGHRRHMVTHADLYTAVDRRAVDEAVVAGVPGAPADVVNIVVQSPSKRRRRRALTSSPRGGITVSELDE